MRWIGSLLLLASGIGNGCLAAVYTVDQFAIDATDFSPGDGTCSAGLLAPPSGGQCTLRAAVMEANTNPGEDTVLIPWRDPAGIPAFEDLGLPVSEPIVLDLHGEDNTALTGDLDILDALTVSISPPIAVLASSSLFEQILPVIDASGLDDRIFDVRGGVSDVQLSGLVLTGGDATGSDGGALRVASGVLGEVTLQAIDLFGNTALSGAAIDTLSPLSLINSRVWANTAANNGAVVAARGTRLTIGLSSLFDNTVPGVGGVVDIRSQGLESGHLRILSSSILSNASSAVLIAGDALAEVQSSTLTDNSQYAILTRFFPGTPAPRLGLSHTVLAAQGLHNCLLDEEVTADLQTVDDFNLEDAASCEEVANGSTNLSGVAPDLSGPAPDVRSWHLVNLPLPHSPLIDAGSPVTVDLDAFGCVPLDQRAVARPQTGVPGAGPARCDIGAIEYRPELLFEDGFE